MTITDHPLHRSRRAALPHRAPALGEDAKALQRIGMADSGRRQAEADQANPMPFPLGEVTGTAGTLVRLRGEVLRVPGEFHYPPVILVQKTVGDPKRRTVNTRTAQWGKFDRPTGRHEYAIELNLPSTPGQYELVLTTQHVDMATHKAGPRLELGRGTLKVLPPPQKTTAP